jgi:phosphoglucomutase/phosphopentomutase
VFTGNQLGVILGYSLVEDLRSSGQGEEKIAVLASAVSSKMLDAIAKADGFHYEERLTGFKWLGNGAIELRTKGYNVPFAYEEAIGFMCGDVVPDKDGVTALARFAELSARLAAAMQPRTVWEYFNDLSRRFGYFVTGNSYFICRDPALTEAIFRRIRYGEGGKEGEVGYDGAMISGRVM